MRLVYDEIVEDALRELADPALQRELWLASEGPLIGSFEECISSLWDDSGLGDALEKAAIHYTAEIDERFRELGRLLDRIDHLRHPEEILEDPLLEEARVLARRLLVDLRRFAEEEE